MQTQMFRFWNACPIKAKRHMSESTHTCSSNLNPNSQREMCPLVISPCSLVLALQARPTFGIYLDIHMGCSGSISKHIIALLSGMFTLQSAFLTATFFVCCFPWVSCCWMDFMTLRPRAYCHV